VGCGSGVIYLTVSVSVNKLFRAAEVLCAVTPPNLKTQPRERYHRVEHT
jgi:hypothetical protein